MNDNLSELNNAWAKAAIKALNGDTRELRLRVQLSDEPIGPTVSFQFNQTNLLSITDLVNRFKITPMTLSRWRRDKKMEFPKEVRVGGRVFFKPHEVNDWWSSKTRPPRYRADKDDVFVKAMNIAIAVSSQLDGAPCCVAENLSPKEAKLFNQGQKEATGFVADYLETVRDRYVNSVSIAPAEKILQEYLSRREGSEG